MTTSRAMRVVFAMVTCWTAAGFIPRVPVGKSFAISPGRSSSSLASRTVARTGDAVAREDPTLAEKLKERIAQFIEGFEESGTPCLPQYSGDKEEARKEELVQKRTEYEWIGKSGDIFENTPFLKANPVPADEVPKLSWGLRVAEAFVKITAGLIKGSIKTGIILGALEQPEMARELQKEFATELRTEFKDLRAETMSDYDRLHSPPMDTPKSVYDFEDDDAFARNRLQGGNCITIQKCTQITYEKLQLSLEQPEYVDFKEKVHQLYLNEKLFVVDQELLADMAPKSEDLEKFLAPCIALFEYDDDNQDLLPIKPIGIQLNQGTVASPIFMPEDSVDGDTTWSIAKLCFEASDFIIHEVVSHLTYTHIVLEGPMVSMNRQLSPDHPINRLLRPHFEGTAYINLQAQEVLIVEGGSVDIVQANDIKDSWGLCVQELTKRISQDFSPPADFAARGMDTTHFPGRYMYRDVGTAYWNAILNWVTEYMDIYYADDEEMNNDYELQAFITELSSTNVEIADDGVSNSVTGGQMAWLSEYHSGSLGKKAFMAKVIATFIYTASTLHAAVNFPQADSMSYSPSCPGAMYAAPPTEKGARTHEDMMAYMQPMYLAATQVQSMTLLGTVHHTRLGHYPPLHFHDIRVHRPLGTFMRAIEDIGTELTVTNADIVTKWVAKEKEAHDATNFAYTTLMPDLIPQSINI
eukprot:jgi/Undpi1/1501/HiC_scaffold_11.g04891.m1